MNYYSDLEWRRATAVVFMWIAAGCSLAVDACLLWREDPEGPALALIVAGAVAATFLLAWMHGAASNLRALGRPLETFSPWSCVGWWFVPFANIFKPPQAMKEIWCRSEPGRSSPTGLRVIDQWWICWLLSGLLGNISVVMGRGTPLILVSVTSSIVLAVAANRIARTMRNVQTNQEDLHRRAVDDAAGQRALAYWKVSGASGGQPAAQLSEFPLVIADQEGAAFGFTCPFCHSSLQLRLVAFREIVACPHGFCTREFRVATCKQMKQASKNEKNYRRTVDAEVKRLRKSREAPPDRISVFGITNAGKSVYLASLYNYLWNGAGDVSGRAKHGLDHEGLLADHAMLARGQWIASTTRTRSFDLALRYNNVKATLTSIDYPGEVFTDVLYRKLQETPEQIELYSQLQSTMAAIVLVDPEQVAGIGGNDRRLDVEYTGIEVAEHMCSRGVGDNIVIVLTKRNRSAALVRSYGGPQRFLEQFIPRLVAAAPTAPILHIASIGVVPNESGQTVPTVVGFDPEEVALPLLRVLERIDPAYLRLLQQIDHDAIAAANDSEVATRRMRGAQAGGGPVEGSAVAS